MILRLRLRNIRVLLGLVGLLNGCSPCSFDAVWCVDEPVVEKGALYQQPIQLEVEVR